ncbi:hypothetical protein NDU88_007806 [Pleurodeles waltl]|uniref:Uncharacterized protein n=1 Tax=Pleurodeles waltl TaxID=8319 RepID=A0AAV7STJ3_PLEWA|nr:hypothetical protein NDU88_007806 [Pleurodeles waltl]
MVINRWHALDLLCDPVVITNNGDPLRNRLVLPLSGACWHAEGRRPSDLRAEEIGRGESRRQCSPANISGAKIDTLATDLNLLHADHQKLADKTRTMEQTLHKLTLKTQRVETSVQSLLNRVAALERRVDGSEGRSRRNNIRVVGLPEDVEGSSPMSYVEKWIKEPIPAWALIPFFTV